MDDRYREEFCDAMEKTLDELRNRYNTERDQKKEAEKINNQAAELPSEISRFEFGKRIVICGEEYILDPGRLEVKEKLNEIEKKAKTAEKETDPNIKAQTMLECAERQIDTLLGDGSCKKIFMGRTMNLNDATHLVKFLTGQIRKMNAR